MKKFALFLIMFIPVTLMSQVKFQDITFDEAMKKAAAESKIILVDVMNPKSMVTERTKIENEILKQKAVQDFFSNNIVCVRMDMSTDAGRKFAPRLLMNMYPTYGFYRANGELIKVVTPQSIAKSPELLLSTAKESVAADAEKKKNTKAIDFKSITFNEALTLAEKENKMVFIDAYTDNCQPCMLMAQNVFTIDEVADVFNANFINVKLNIGTTETELAKKYGTKVYPSYLFVNSKGDLIYSNSGYTDAENFIGYANQAIKKFSGIEFQHGSWKEIVEMSKKSGKPIFLDCYTPWCGPCKKMLNTVFREPDVAEYFNQNFINVKVDMSKGEGLELKKQFDVKAFPTFVFIDSEGNVLNRLVGSMTGSEFITATKEGLLGRGLTVMQKRYNAGERDRAFILDYLDVLKSAYLTDVSDAVVKEFFSTITLEDMKEKKIWGIFCLNINDPDCLAFKHLCDNQPDFEKLYGTTSVKGKMNYVWSNGYTKYATKDADGKKMIDTNGYEFYLNRMKKAELENLNDIIFNAETYFAQHIGDWKKFYKTVDQRIKDKKQRELSDREMYDIGNYLLDGCKDKEIRQKSAKWFESALKRIEASEKEQNGKATSMSFINFKSAFTKFITELKK